MNPIYRIARRFRAACRTNEQQASTVLMLSLMMGVALLQQKDAADIPLSVWVVCIGFWPMVAFLANLHSPIPEQDMEPIAEPLPYDLGNNAYLARKLPSENPFPADDWRHDEWLLGWSHAEECDSYSYDWAAGKFKPETGSDKS